MVVDRAQLIADFTTGQTMTEPKFADARNAFEHIGERNSHNAVTEGADNTNNSSVDSQPALQATIANAQASGGEIYLPAGTYYLGSQWTWPLSGKTPLRIRGAGRGLTTIRPQNSKSIATPLIGTTGGNANTNILQFAEVSGLTIINEAPNGNNGTYGLDITNAEHSVFRNLQVSQGSEAAMRIDYSYSCSFADILAQNADKFGIVCTNTVFNQMSFRNITCLLNGVAGFYSVGGNGLNMIGCGFEDNDVTGIYINRMRGALLSGCYWERNASTQHQFLTRDGLSFSGGAWDVNGEIMIAGAGSAPTTSLPTNCGIVSPSSGIKITGCDWNPGGANSNSFLTAAGVDGLEVDHLGYGDNYTGNPDNYGLLELYGDHNLARDVTWNDRKARSGKDSSKVRTFVTPITHDTDAGDWQVRRHQYGWVESNGFSIDISTFANINANGTYTDTTKTYRQTLPIYSIVSDDGLTDGYWGTTIPTADYPEFHGKKCICEMGFYPLAEDAFSATTYSAGLQAFLQGSDGIVQSDASIAAKVPDDVATTCSTVNASNVVTVADATGLVVGRPVCVVDGAGSSNDLTTFIAGISGNTITLDDAAGDTLSGLSFFQPAMQVLTTVFLFPDVVENFAVRARYVGAESGVTGRRTLLVYCTIREVGSPPIKLP